MQVMNGGASTYNIYNSRQRAGMQNVVSLRTEDTSIWHSLKFFADMASKTKNPPDYSPPKATVHSSKRDNDKMIASDEGVDGAIYN